MTYGRGQAAVDWEERYDLGALRAKRVARARDALAASGLDALLLWKNENIRYLTSLRAQIIAGKDSSLNGVLLPAGEEPLLLASGGEVDKAAAGMPWLAAPHPIPIMEQRELVDGFVRETLRPMLRELGIEGGRLGMDQPHMALLLSITEQLPDLEIRDGDEVMHRARRIKLDEEIAIVEEACAIGDAVTQRALDEARAGRREYEVAGDAMQTLFHLGGEMAHVVTPFVASGEHMAPPHRISTDKIIRNGDICFIDIGAMWNGYFADIGRTTIVGRPNRRQKEIYTAVYEALMAGISVMRQPSTNQDVAHAIIEKVGQHGLEQHLFSLFIGHGIGIGANEPPYIGETLPGATTYELEPNMLFAVEPLVWVPGVRGGGGVRLEDMVLVTEGEPRVLSRVAYEDRLML